MPYNVEATGSLTRSVQVTVPRDEYEKNVDKQLKKLSGRVKIRGFRKGKIPLPVMRKHYGDSVQRDVLDGLVNRYLDEILKEEENVLYVAQPEVTKFGEEEVGVEFKVQFELRPKIDPIGYKGIEVEKPRIEVDSKDIDEQLEALRKQFSTLEPIELRETIKEGDIVTFDFTALDDDPALADFEGTDAEVTIGEKNTLPGIEEALTGAKFGTTLRADVTPGDQFQVEELRGRTFAIEITIKSVKQRVLPELDDDLARDTGEAETLLELRQKIREGLAHQKEHSASHFAEANLIERLIAQNDFELPPLFVNQQIDNGLRRQLQQFTQQGFELDQLGLDLSSLRETLRDETEEQLRAEFLLLAIAEKEKLEVGDADLDSYFSHQAMHSKVSPEQMKRWYRQDNSRMQQAAGGALLEKTVNYLLEEATIKEIDWPTEEEQEEKAAALEGKKAAKNAKKEAAPKKKAAASEEPAAAAASGDEASSFDAMTVDDLKDLLRANDLKVGGKKTDLIERLVEAGVSPT